MAALPAEKARERKKPIGSIGSLVRSSQATKAAMSTAPRTNEPTTSGLPHPASLPRTRAHTKPSTPPVTSARPRRSRLVSVPWLSRIFVSTSGTATSADGDVDPEDPLPRQTLDDRAADQRAAGHGQAGDGAEHPDRRTAALGREGGAQQGQAERDQERRAGALQRARGDEHADVRRQRARGRSRGEQRHAEGVEVAPPVAVAEGRAGHQQDGEAQVVGVDRPLELLDGRAEVEADRAQRGRHDQRVERRHERADGGQHDDPAGHVLGLRGRAHVD